MKLLLDTHVWLWMQAAPSRLSESTVELLEDLQNQVFLSAASSWEIAIKYSIGRLSLPVAPMDYVTSRMAQSGTLGLPVQHRHALNVATLPAHHGDPFDRLLVSQAQLENLTLITTDRQLDAYDVPKIQA